MARRTFDVIDICEIFTHWYAGRSKNEIAVSLACSSTSACVAVGNCRDTSGAVQGLLLTGFGSSWTSLEAPLPTGAATSPSVRLASVACPSASGCVVAGDYADSEGNGQGLVLTGSGSSWAATELPMPADAAPNPDANLDSAACSSPTLCTLVGWCRLPRSWALVRIL
jgi:hypothetical protein